jgi:hypothetical protein
MAVNFSVFVYLPCQEIFGRPVTVTPLVSQPTAGSYSARGIFRTHDTVIDGGEVGAVISDQESVLYVRDTEFAVVPMQGDMISIPTTNGIPPPGSSSINDPPAEFVVSDVNTRGGGETMLQLQKYMP